MVLRVSQSGTENFYHGFSENMEITFLLNSEDIVLYELNNSRAPSELNKEQVQELGMVGSLSRLK